MNHRVQVKVADYENENGIKISAEDDRSLNEESVLSVFPDCHTLAYKHGNKWKAVDKKKEKFLEPKEGWGSRKYIVVKGKKIKFRLTNAKLGLSEQEIKDRLQSYGIVETQKYDKTNKVGFVIIKFISDAHLETMKTQQHPFELTEVLQHTDSEKFTKRQGTTDNGHEFENLTMASILLNLTLDETVEDFKLSSNDEDFGSFDDIVVWKKLINGDVHKYAIQLKYKNDTNKIFLKNYLTRVNGDFSIQKYFKDFKDMIESTKSYDLILYTNLKFNMIKGEVGLKLGNTEIKLKVVEQKVSKEFDCGSCYKFCPTNEDVLSDEQKMFFTKFLLYPNRPNVQTIKARILQIFHTKFSLKNFSNYSESISEWSNKTRKKKLTKNFIKKLIALQMLATSIKSFPFIRKEDSEKILYLKQAISKFSVTVVDKKYFENVKKIWENETVTVSEIEKVISDFQLKNLRDDEKRVVALWIMNKCPLIITESETAYKVFSLCREKHFLLLKKNDTPVPKDLRVFTKLTDLDPNSATYKNIVKAFYCSIQGKQAITLEDLIKQYKKFENSVTTNELIQMIDGPLCIGKQETVVDIYIDRFVTRLTIAYNYFDYIDEDTLVIISCQGKVNVLKHRFKNFNLINIEDYLNQKGTKQMENYRSDKQTKVFGRIQEKTAYFSKNQCSRETFDIICKRNSSKKKCHHFRIIEKDVLEWMYSKGDISDLQEYKTNSSFLKETDLFNTEEYVNIITADPGMGKTELMKKLNNMYSSSCWSILISAKDCFEYLLRKDNFFKILSKNICKTKFEMDVLNAFKNTKKITFLWDGLDELSSTQIDIALSLIDDLVKEGFKQWISCRKHLDNKLENKFNVLSRSIKQFDKEEQRNYIYRHLSSDKEINLEEVVHKIQHYVDKVQYNEILGIPLQISMLIELLKQSTLLDSLLNKIFSITDLYEHFIKMKFEIFFEKNNKPKTHLDDSVMKVFRENLFTYHQKEALKIFVHDQFSLDKLNIYLNSTVPDKDIIYRIGIITGKTDNGQSQFLHYSYAEYLVALFFHEHRKNFNLLIKEHIFQEHYQNVRFMFDLLLAKNCPAHLAVLYNNFDYLKSCEDYTCKDEGGRNPLHIACAWGPRFRLLNKTHDFLISGEQVDLVNFSSRPHYDDMLNFLLEYNNVLDKDSLFNSNSIEYADLSLSLKPLIIISRNKFYVPFKALKNFKDIKDNNAIDCIRVLLKDEMNQSKINARNQYNVTLIFYAIEKGHYELVKYLAESGADVNIEDKDGNVPIHVAAENGDIEIVKLLVNDWRAKVDAQNNEGFTPIYLAAQNDHYEVVKYLAESGADVNIQEQDGWIPIHIAAFNGHIKIVKLLVSDLKVNVNAKTKKGFTSIHLATENGDYELVKYLVESGADVNTVDHDCLIPIHIAAFNGHIQIIRLFVNDLQMNMNIRDSQGLTPIYLAAANDYHEVVKYLAESGADVNIQNQNGHAPIHIAAFDGHFEMVKLLVNDLSANVNVKNVEGMTPIYLAAHIGHYKIVKFLVDKGADIRIQNKDDFVPIHTAAQNGHTKVVKLLVNDLRANVDAQNNEGFTPIYLAIQNNHYKVVKYLAESGADINIQNQDGMVPIHLAAQNGYIQVVRLLVNWFKIDVNVKYNSFTPIYLAAENGHYEVVEYLLHSGADVNIRNQNRALPIHAAAFKGDIDIIKLLVNNFKANVNAKDNEGCTPIYLAAQDGHYKMVKYLAESGADVNIQNQNGYAPIHIAVFNGHIDVVKLLVNDLKVNVNAKIEEGSSLTFLGAQNGHHETVWYVAGSARGDLKIKTRNGYTPIHIAAQNGHIDMVKLLVDLKANVNKKNVEGLTPIYLATENGHYEVVKFLAKNGADVKIKNKDGWRLIHLAAQNGYIQMVKLLVNNIKANMDAKNVDGLTPMYLAAEKGHDKVVKFLAKNGADVKIKNKDGWRLIHTASQKGHIEVVKLLVCDLKADVNAKTKIGSTPMYLAASNGHYEVVKYLAESGASVNIQNGNGGVPIHVAAFHGHIKIVKLLVNDLEADVNAKNKISISPIYLAAEKDHYEVVKFLAESGADVNIQNHNGWTPIHIAVINGHINVVKLLVEDFNANVNVRTNNGSTPIHLASIKSHHEIIGYLFEKGADV